ncbi:cysteine-rich receptor-like protein kinase 26 [Arachis stenosperma]|uniref:cysteine-rich receptor-like protein kinase 26 n=1 Tax=Arachis stenosperma TaxID=217475 RepID=UPI0025ACF546|nr:cysteine-rich receptor-like protein kinase 26 [Arachis stenosperma]
MERTIGNKREKRKAYALTKPNPLSSPITPITANLPFLPPSPTKATIATAHQAPDSRNHRATHSHLQQQRSSFATHSHPQQQRSSFATQTNPHRVEPTSSSPKVTELTEPASSFADYCLQLSLIYRNDDELMILCISLILYRRKKNQKNYKLDLPYFDMATLISATNNFSTNNILGKGGFGAVYKVNT